MTLTVAPGSHVQITGDPFVGEVIVGLLGAMVSIVTGFMVVIDDVFPVASVAVAVTIPILPSESGASSQL